MNYKRQKGAVLLIAIILLLVMTIIGVSAVNSSAVKTQIAGNSISRMMVYQGAESALAQSISSKSIKHINTLDASGLETMNIPGLVNENIHGGATLALRATLTKTGQSDCMRISGLASSTTMKCMTYRVDGFSNIQSTNARGHHIKGIEIDSPASN